MTAQETEALERSAEAWGLTRGQVMGAHLTYLEALVATALADGKITRSERQDLDDVARLLGITTGTLEALVARRKTNSEG